MSVGDVVLSVNGSAIATPKDLSRAIADLAPGDQAALVVQRAGAEVQLAVTVGKMEGVEAASASQTAPGGEVAVADLGLTLRTLEPTQAEALGLPDGTAGALIAQVDPGSEAADKGLREGDVILSVNQAPVESAQDVVADVEAAKEKHRDAALLMIARGDSRSFVAVPFHVG
jgi:serine protease Do